MHSRSKLDFVISILVEITKGRRAKKKIRKNICQKAVWETISRKEWLTRLKIAGTILN